MEIILKEDVPKLGSRGDVVKVAEGYGRNYLLPRKLAIEASAANKAVIEQMKASSVRRGVKEKSDAELLAKQFDGVSLDFTRRSGENDQLFGSVTPADIAHELEREEIRKAVFRNLISRLKGLIDPKWPVQPFLYTATGIESVMKLISRNGFSYKGRQDVRGNKFWESLAEPETPGSTAAKMRKPRRRETA